MMRARFRFRRGHGREMIRQPRLHPDQKAGELTRSVADHVGTERRSEAGSLEAQQCDRARIQPRGVEGLMAETQGILG